jgi:hypothetical protein
MGLKYVALAVVGGALCAAGIVACGGDDDAPIVPVETTTAPVEALSQEEFIKEADAVCEEANAAIANLTQTTATGGASQQAGEREIVEGELDQIQDLGAPNQDETTLNEFIDAREKLVDNLDKQDLAAQRDDTAALAELEAEESTIRGEALAAADEYGFKQCGEEGEATTDTAAGGTAAGSDTGTGVPAPAPAPTAPAAPAPTAPAPAAPAPVAPAPAAPAPAPPSGGTGTGGTGGGTGGSGGVSP